MVGRFVAVLWLVAVVVACSSPEVDSGSAPGPAAPSTAAVSTSVPTTRPTSTVETIATTIVEPQAETDVSVLADYVEEATGRTFEIEPVVEFTSDRPETLDLHVEFFTDERMWQLLTLLDLIEPADGNRAGMVAAARARLDQVRGFCCPVRMFENDDHPLLTSVIVVHELTHLIDGERRNVAPYQPPEESVDMWTTVAEGNAQRVALAYRNELRDDGARSDRFITDWSHPDIPDAFLQILEFPYQEGARFSQGLEESGGLDLVDRSFAQPPISSKQVLDVDAYLSGDRPVPVRPPDDGIEPLQRGVIGAFVLKLLLERHVPNGDALILARQWAGDAYVIHRSGDELCLRADVVMETAAAASELRETLRRSPVPAQPGGDPETVEVRRCLETPG